MSACTAQEKYAGGHGLFYNSTNERIFELLLLPDNQFNLKIKSPPHSISECSGKWIRGSDKLMILTCAEEPGEAQLSSNYMNKRVWEVEIKTKNRLQLNHVVLKRK
ncbi:MAG: hypothetical protein KY428_11375 [Bacteroidetes bacterium]|nr:hypothetical protein [Bacteroidota bacterium]